MKEIHAYELAKAVNGTILSGSEDTLITSVSTNSKEIEAGALFVPIVGERVDAHDFIDMALEAMDEIIDKECFVMNYPYGNYSEEVISYVKQKGCGLGVSVEARGAQLGVDNRFALPRWDCNDVYPKGEKV